MNKKKNKLSTSKLLMLFLLINCTAIQIYTMVVIILSMKMGLGADFEPLKMLITTVVTEAIGYAIYSLKASKENTVGGIVYETAMKKLEADNLQQEEQEEAEG